MNILEKIHAMNKKSELPLISLNKLQENFLNHNKKSNTKLTQLIDAPDNIKQFKVTSPFYDRMATHKQNCKCPYHRRKRMQISPHRSLSKNQQFGLNGNNKNHRNSSNLNLLQNNKQNRNNRGFSKLSDDENLFRYTYQDQNSSKYGWNGVFSKTDTKNQGFQQFLKKYQLLMLQKNGFNGGKSPHIVKKGVKQIFQFIKSHLDYTVQKMRNHIEKLQKDRDFNDFYIERFVQLKNNYLGRNSPKTSQQKIQKKKISTKKKLRKISQPQLQKFSIKEQNNIQVVIKKKPSRLSLNDVIEHIQKNGIITAADIKQFLDCDLQAFKTTFIDFNKNIKNGKYDEAFLKKIQTKLFQEILKNTKIDPPSEFSQNIEDLAQKRKIIEQSHEILKKMLFKYQKTPTPKNQSPGSTGRNFFINKSRRATELQRTSIYDTNIGKKQSQRQSQFSQNDKKQSQIHIEDPNDHNDWSQNDQNSKLRDLICITQESNTNIQNDQVFKIKSSSELFRNSRRSKLLGRQSFGKSSFLQLSQLQGDQEFRSRRFIDSQKIGLKKAQKFLFQANLGGIVVKQDDSIITAKRKLRVIRTLLKQNQKLPQAAQLKEYMRIIQQKIRIKIQKKSQKSNQNNKTKQELEDQNEIDFSKLLSIDIFGYKLIFYDLSAMVNFQDFDDLCLMLNEISMVKKLSSKVSYRWIYEQQEQIKDVKIHEDQLIQTDFKDPLFYQIEKKDENIQNQDKTIFFQDSRATKIKLNWKATDQSGQCFLNEEQVKKAFVYAKQNLPQTFKTYVKNSSNHKQRTIK